MKRNLIPLFFVLILLANPGAIAQSERPPAQVEVMAAQKRLMAPMMEATGTVISLNDSAIASEVEGPLTWIAHVGTRVDEGDKIATLDDRLLRTALVRSEARVKRLEADLKFREQEVARFTELKARDTASQARLDETIATRDRLAADLDEARADLEKSQGDLERSIIRAPFAGHVAERLASVGEYVNTGNSLVRLVDTDSTEVTLFAPITSTTFLAEGQLLAVENHTGTVMLPVRTVVPVGNLVTRMVEVRLSITEQPWHIGTALKVFLPRSKPMETIAVPRDGLIFRSNQVYFFRVGEDGTAQQITADLEAAIGPWVSVKLKSGGPLKDGDKIIVRGAERLSPGAPVTVIKEHDTPN